MFKLLVAMVLFLGIASALSANGNAAVFVLVSLGLLMLVFRLMFSGLGALLGREATGFVIGTYVVRAIDRLLFRRRS